MSDRVGCCVTSWVLGQSCVKGSGTDLGVTTFIDLLVDEAYKISFVILQD